MSESGYYRFPTVFANTIVFASEDDLWTVSAAGGVARRLTTGLGSSAYPRYSPDGGLIAFSGQEEGPMEVYLMPASGGAPRRLTYLGADAMVTGWTPDGRIVFASNAGRPFARMVQLFAVSPADKRVQQLPYGPALTVSFGPGGASVIGRYGMATREPAYWKRYRGGTAGDIWVDPAGGGTFRRLITLEGNVTHPLWLGERIYFASDHEGVGNLYSCDTNGGNLRRHTSHADYYVRHPSSDGASIVYHAGADLYQFDAEKNRSRRVPVTYASPRTQRNRKFFDAARYLDEYALHPQGHILAAVTRGKPFVFGNWEGPAAQLGESDGVRYRLPRWLHDGNGVVLVSDAAGEESLEIHSLDKLESFERLGESELGLNIGRPRALKPSPTGTMIALTNHRSELILVDTEKPNARVLDCSAYHEIFGFDWSPDGRWIAYACSRGTQTIIIKICDISRGETRAVTAPGLADINPVFSPDGRYLYFVGFRELNPVMDELQFDLGFPRGARPYVLTLQKDEPSPFIPDPKPLQSGDAGDGAPDRHNSHGERAESDGAAGADKRPEPVTIEFDGIADRIEAFPVPERRYRAVFPLKDKVMFTHLPIEGALNQSWTSGRNAEGKAVLELFDFDTQRTETLVSGFSELVLSDDRTTMAYRAGDRLRVVKAGEKPEAKNAEEEPGRKSGWVNLGRLKASLSPPAEWRQMYRHAWRLQRDHFWSADLAQVDWAEVYERYRPLLDRVGTRGEFSDLMWEMQGELGTSHAYEIGGDYRQSPNYRLGVLGADLEWDEASSLWRITRVVRGDPADRRASSPLLRPGVNGRAGETILGIDGRRPNRELSPAELLLNKADTEIALILGDERGENRRTVRVQTLTDEQPLRYRDWVESNRRLVHECTGGRAGYVHIPDMGANGYAEFHRSFLVEIERDGLVVDVRFNRGGFVSALLLEKLARRRLAFVKTRWFGVSPWPEESPPGPTVALTNEWAGSDGDIFSHSVKLLGLGPLVGKRTWGGVVGIWPRERLVDRGITTQPEFSFWFVDVGWEVENYGSEPDIEVEVAPQDYAAGRDPQLERAIAEIERIMQSSPAASPRFDAPPSRAAPGLPGM